MVVWRLYLIFLSCLRLVICCTILSCSAGLWLLLLQLLKVKVAKSVQLIATPCTIHTVHGILQARILEWVAFPFSRGSSQPRDRTQVSCIAGRFFTNWAMQLLISHIITGVLNWCTSNHLYLYTFLFSVGYSINCVRYRLLYHKLGFVLTDFATIKANMCSEHV